jgi:hypothetical protein
MQDIFTLNGMKYLYCPTRAMMINGTTIQNISQSLEISIESCNQALNPAC